MRRRGNTNNIVYPAANLKYKRQTDQKFTLELKKGRFKPTILFLNVTRLAIISMGSPYFEYNNVKIK